jgi:hypothetical protein
VILGVSCVDDGLLMIVLTKDANQRNMYVCADLPIFVLLDDHHVRPLVKKANPAGW